MRLFFALWPDPAVRRALERIVSGCRGQCRGRAIPPDNLHVTLAFLGEVEANRLAVLEEIGEATAADPFDLVLDRIGYFRRTRIVYAGASQVSSPLTALASNLAAALARQGFRTEARAFVPHVTLVRDARHAPPMQEIDPLLWHVRHIALIESSRSSLGQVYTPLRRFMLSN